MMTKRQAIITAVESALKLIKTAGGYLTQLPDASIKIWNLTAVPNQTYFVNIRDVEESRGYKGNGYEESTTVDIEVTIQAATPYASMCNLIQDIDKAMKAYTPSRFEIWHVRPGKVSKQAEITDRPMMSANIEYEILHQITESWAVDTVVY